MMTCSTCRHWQKNESRYNSIVLPRRPDSDWEMCETEEEAAALFGHRVRYCKHPKVLFYQRPEIDGAAVCDGSEFQAELITAEKFGCVLHEPE